MSKRNKATLLGKQVWIRPIHFSKVLETLHPWSVLESGQRVMNHASDQSGAGVPMGARCCLPPPLRLLAQRRWPQVGVPQRTPTAAATAQQVQAPPPWALFRPLPTTSLFLTPLPLQLLLVGAHLLRVLFMWLLIQNSLPSHLPPIHYCSSR